ncbi:t-SNARE [Ceraceosorus guamensis]|uniref:t-SNARE n=1 Tax=Ceraceosorus guamensis TaxID=1522189 RepID=A0A316VVX0_9BASI|nr:t-SNARE [Ceraceosorus guamensis]PWN41797.1 t-SNARE [Ceraceosorus guamensis]
MSNLTSRTSSPFAGGSGSASGAGSAQLEDQSVGVIRSRTLLFLSYRSSAPLGPSGSGFSSHRSSLGYGEGESWDSQSDSLLRSAMSRAAGQSSSIDVESQRDASSSGTKVGTFYDSQGALTSYPPRSGYGADDVGSSSLPPKWVDTSDEVDAVLNSVRPKIDRLDKLHNKHLLPGFADRSKEEQEIEGVTVDITREFRRATSLIRQLASATSRQIASSQMSAREASMARNVQTALATRVQDMSADFRKRQADYMRRMRGIEERHKSITKGSGLGAKREKEEALREDIEMSQAHLSKSSQSDSQSQLLLQEEEQPRSTQVQVSAEADIQARDREIDQIAKSITDLAELFQDLNALVIDQGTMLDRIDYNIENMGRDMQESVRELNQAKHYQSRTSRGQCILLLVLLIMLALALLIIKPFWRSFTSASPAGNLPVPTQTSPFSLNERIRVFHDGR